jgi:FkbM family methyltransferase
MRRNQESIKAKLKSLKLKIRDTLASFFRSMPNFKGKQSLGVIITSVLTNYNDPQECFVTVEMFDGSLISLDLRGLEKFAYFTGSWDYDILKQLLKILMPNDVVLDIGANIGFYSIALGLQLKKLGGGKLYSFEPVQPNFLRLKHQIAQNDLEQIISLFNLALGNEEGEISLYMRSDNNSSTGNAFCVGDNENKLKANYSSRLTKLDTFAKENGIDRCNLIKVDIEGGEFNFFGGGENFITKTRPIILSEFNPYFAEQYGYDFQDIIRLASSWRYDLYEQKRDKFVLIEDNLTDFANFLMIPEEKKDFSLKIKLSQITMLNTGHLKNNG